jgi:hypothetical protein
MEVVVIIGGILFWLLGILLAFGRISGSEVNMPNVIGTEILCIFSWVAFILFWINYSKETNTKFFNFK